jgi:hypothetical protein
MRSQISQLADALLFALPPRRAMARAPRSLEATVTGTCSFADWETRKTVEGRISEGTLTVTGFSASGGTLLATGTLRVTCAAVNSLGQTVTRQTTRTATTAVAVSVARVGGPCRLLHLSVRPVDLDALGLIGHTDACAIDVMAQSGPGNLLGNLLWAVENALDNGAPAGRLAELLDHVVAIRS